MTVLFCVLYFSVLLLTDATLCAALESQSICCTVVAKQRNSEGHRSRTMIKNFMMACHSDENNGMQNTSRRKKMINSPLISVFR